MWNKFHFFALLHWYRFPEYNSTSMNTHRQPRLYTGYLTGLIARSLAYGYLDPNFKEVDLPLAALPLSSSHLVLHLSERALEFCCPNSFQVHVLVRPLLYWLDSLINTLPLSTCHMFIHHLSCLVHWLVWSEFCFHCLSFWFHYA